MKPLIEKRIRATKSFRCLVGPSSVCEQKLIGVLLCPAKPCKRTLQPVRRLAMGPVGWSGNRLFLRSICLLGLVVALCISVHLCCLFQVSELWPNTDWQNENRAYARFK